MFRRSVVRLAQEARRPAIKFPDRKAGVEHASHEPHPHPAAPKEVAENFGHFQEVFQSGPHFHPEKIQASSSSPSAQGKATGKDADVFEDVHDLPKRFWQTPALAIEESEMDAIMSGGATLVQGQ